jgi:hypothetical protein
MSEQVPIENEDFWVKVAEMLQQNWAIIEPEAAGGVRRPAAVRLRCNRGRPALGF